MRSEVELKCVKLSNAEIYASDRANADDNGYGVGQKVQVWDDDEEEWYAAIIQKIDGDQYRVHYIGYDSSEDEWVDLDEIRDLHKNRVPVLKLNSRRNSGMTGTL